ncbi:MAG: hypothetical protein HN712_26945 [Gemmatimonadetes bacterium]|jgi:hypothetical protein|nr:hypothetical protein [Gemmatimonadota bacterium]MBT6147546.1 hypothetical protein [Gemmatimonadota bacterium]MBT7863979.1 hypothetical protein [Gemmatimonadota bacterium]
MTPDTEPATTRQDEDDVVILYRGGRLPSWDQLDAEQQLAVQQEHVDLMLSVAGEHHLQSMYGYRLVTPRGAWERFWTIAFPNLAGAEAWMSAEVAPPYGRYGYYEYDLARRWRPESLAWLPQRTIHAEDGADPRVVPALAVDAGSIVVLCFSRWQPGSDEIAPHVRGDELRRQRLQDVAGDHGLLHGEVFRLVGSGRDGDLVWILEFPDLVGAEAWINAEVAPPGGSYHERTYHLSRRWAPAYFASWSSP